MKKKLITTAKYLWVVAIIVFVALYFYTHFDSIINIINIIPLFNLIIAFTTLFLAKLLLSYVALLSVKYVDTHLAFSRIFTIYNITQLAKYIPGSIWQFVGKAGAYANEGMNSTTIKKSIFIEMLWVLMSAFIVGMVLGLTGDILNLQFIITNTQKYFLFYIFALTTVLAVAGFYYKKTLSFINLFLQNISLNIKMFCTLLIVWSLLGMSFFITLTPYLEMPSGSLYIDIVGLYALAYAIGFLIPFAPAGIGIREAILVGGLTSFLTTDQAIVLASLNRIIYIILEVAIVIILTKIRFFLRKKV